MLDELAYHLSQMWPLLYTYICLIGAAVLAIFAGAHASLSRPSSAAKPKRKTGRKHGSRESAGQRMEGLSPSDAILYPLMTGLLLTFLYFLIQWLKDPDILNTIINWYLSGFGIFSVTKLVGDCLSVWASFLLPECYSSGEGVWVLDQKARKAIKVQEQMDLQTKAASRSSPLPAIFSRLPLPPAVMDKLWLLRSYFTEALFTVEVYARGLLEGQIDIGLSETIAITISIASSLYFNLVSKPWWLTNLFGFSFSYSALQLMSPTTFWTGTLVLTSLFFYDIYFVFFTPMMVTVATKLDVPVKLLIPKPSEDGTTKPSLAMLGLGDIVLPGIMIGLALRYDLYLFYLKKQQREKKRHGEPTAAKEKPEALGKDLDAVNSSTIKASNSTLVFDKTGLGKAEYVDATGRWGERFWLGGKTTQSIEGGIFPKVYFQAALTGYVAGMICTVGIMHFWQHAQPALLYLVPSVLVSLWGTALVRGELQTMWNYTEEESSDKTSKKQKSENKGGGEAKEVTVKEKEQGNTAVADDSKDSKSSEAPVSEKPEKSASTTAEAKDGSSQRKQQEQKGRYFFFAINKPDTTDHEKSELKLDPELKKDLRAVSKD